MNLARLSSTTCFPELRHRINVSVTKQFSRKKKEFDVSNDFKATEEHYARLLVSVMLGTMVGGNRIEAGR